MKIHIEGMGVQGSFLAFFLAKAGVNFTWNDTDAEHVAWKACTGAIYPANSTKFGLDWQNYQWWLRTLKACPELEPFFERCEYWFTHKRPPHEGWRDDLVRISRSSAGDVLRMGDAESLHFNAQTFVPHVRELFKEQRTDVAPELSLKIVSHGFGRRNRHYYWGWTAPVVLRYELPEPRHGRPCFYFRKGRFDMAYAYPIPGTNSWYAGSSIIRQFNARPLNIQKHYENWLRYFQDGAAGLVTIDSVGPFVEGWRPAAHREDDAWAQWEDATTISLRPLWNNGVRHFGQQLGALQHLIDAPLGGLREY